VVAVKHVPLSGDDSDRARDGRRAPRRQAGHRPRHRGRQRGGGHPAVRHRGNPLALLRRVVEGRVPPARRAGPLPRDPSHEIESPGSRQCATTELRRRTGRCSVPRQHNARCVAADRQFAASRRWTAHTLGRSVRCAAARCPGAPGRSSQVRGVGRPNASRVLGGYAVQPPSKCRALSAGILPRNYSAAATAHRRGHRMVGGPSEECSGCQSIPTELRQFDLPAAVRGFHRPELDRRFHRPPLDRRFNRPELDRRFHRPTLDRRFNRPRCSAE
jgi:hypothetical protein